MNDSISIIVLLGTIAVTASTVGLFIFLFKNHWKYKLIEKSGLFLFQENRSSRETDLMMKKFCEKIQYATNIDLLLISGLHAFSNNSPLRRAIEESNAKINILLLHPGSINLKVLNRNIKGGMALQELESIIKESTKFIEGLQKNNVNLTLKFYKDIPIWKIIRIDHEIFIQSYANSNWSWEMPWFGYSAFLIENRKRDKFEFCKTSQYFSFLNYFNELLKRSENIQ